MIVFERMLVNRSHRSIRGNSFRQRDSIFDFMIVRRTTLLAPLVFVVFGNAETAPNVRNDTVLMQGNRTGSQTVAIREDGTVRSEYSYNDRDHGDRITATWKLDSAGIPVAYEGRGHDYMKAPVEEQFRMQGGHASWKNRRESGEQTVQGPAFFMPANPPPEFYGVLARALLRAPDQRLALLPSGWATIAPAGSLVVSSGDDRAEWFEYRISGLDFMPLSVWLDAKGATTAHASLWLSTVIAGHEADLFRILSEQDKTNAAWFASLAHALTQIPKGDLVVRNACLFDPRDLSVTPGTSVLVRGDRIVRVAPDARLQPGAGAHIIDARGRFLMPGLWDCHAHIDGVDGMLNIANGVTSARDLGNDTDVFLKRVARFDAGTEIGPRVLKAGIIDGKGPNAGPFKTLVETATEAVKVVDWYADHGYVQIKMYMSLKPDLVPIIADRAHERGLRVSGHVPAFMSARQFIEAGADELQHLNYVVLNFLYPQVQETTRMSERFIKVGVHAREFTPDKAEVRDFIAFLKRHHTVIDPTLGLLQARLAGGPTQVTPGLERIAARFPSQVHRNLMGGAYEAPVGHEAAYREAIPSMLKLLRALHEAGIAIVPGTDALAGYQLHHELELYVRAGIPAAEVLRMATLTPATVMGVDRDLGAIQAGKYADMILIDGDPTRRISNTRRVNTVIKSGKIYDPVAIEQALGIVATRDDP
jgi:imidazolonepropionase-like amidohydrolase